MLNPKSISLNLVSNLFRAQRGKGQARYGVYRTERLVLVAWDH